METLSSSIKKGLTVLGVFGITTFIVYGATGNGGVFFKSSVYQTRSATADAKLSAMTNGAGAGILDKVVANIKAKAEIKGGTPLNVTLYNNYIDDRLAYLDKLDNQVEAKYGTDYAFLFQYIYPRVNDLRKPTNQTAFLMNTIADTIGQASNSSSGTLSTKTSTTPAGSAGTVSFGPGPSGSNNTTSNTAPAPAVQCTGTAPSGPGVMVSGYSNSSFGGGTNGTQIVYQGSNPGRSGCTWSCTDGYMANETLNGCRAITDKDFIAKREALLNFPAYVSPITDPAEIARLQSIRTYANQVLKDGRTTQAWKLLAETANKPEYAVSSWEMATALNMTWEGFSRINNALSIKYTNDNGAVGEPGTSRALIPASAVAGSVSGGAGAAAVTSTTAPSSPTVSRGTFIGSCPGAPGKDNTAFYCGPTNPGAGWADVGGGCYHQCIAQ